MNKRTHNKNKNLKIDFPSELIDYIYTTYLFILIK